MLIQTGVDRAKYLGIGKVSPDHICQDCRLVGMSPIAMIRVNHTLANPYWPKKMLETHYTFH